MTLPSFGRRRSGRCMQNRADALSLCVESIGFAVSARLIQGENRVRGVCKLAAASASARRQGVAAAALAFGVGLLCASATAPIHAACREAATSPLPMPAWTWLRSWRADLSAPSRLATEAEGRVMVTDPVRGKVVARRADGSIAFVKRELGRPTSIAIDADGRYWVGDGETGRVTMYEADWTPRHSLGVGDGEFGMPGDIAIDPSNREIFVSDTDRHQVAVYSSSGLRLRTIGAPAPTDGLPAADGLFRSPTGIALAGSEVLVSDHLNYRVQAFDKATGAFLYCVGNYTTPSFFSPASGPTRAFGAPQGIAVDALGRMYVADAYQGLVRVIDRGNGAVLGSIGAFGDGPGEMRVPVDLVIDRHGRLFVATTDNSRLDVFSLDASTDPERFLPSTVRLSPDSISRTATSGTVTASIEVPGHRAVDIPPASVSVNGQRVTALGVEDADGNGVAELRVAVAAGALRKTLGDATPAEVNVSGSIGTLGFTAVTAIALVDPPPPPPGSGDSDGDGIPDARDACPATPTAKKVNAQGCSIEQLCPCTMKPDADDSRRHGGRHLELRTRQQAAHGAYVKCVEQAAKALVKARRIPAVEFHAIVRAAAKSSCGRKP
jgi:DNA-binding beta-propeller fold protein YncE